ncbi:MAG: HEPN domain-containing protein [Bacteroidales bacterium]|nr:HEPN domain-containing protein [Bacteroidales bacterium]
MTDEERTAIVAYRLERAQTTLSDAKKLIELEMYSTAANRLYYAFYYAASSLLISKGLSAHTHSGLQTMIHFQFVKNGSLTTEDGALMRRLFTLRQESDYDDFFDVDANDIIPLLEPTTILIQKIKNLTELP